MNKHVLFLCTGLLLANTVLAQGTGMVSTDPLPEGPAAPAAQQGQGGQVLPALAAGDPDTLRADAALLDRPLASGITLKTLPQGTEVVIERSMVNAAGSWCYVRHADGGGWVAAKALNHCKP